MVFCSAPYVKGWRRDIGRYQGDEVLDAGRPHPPEAMQKTSFKTLTSLCAVLLTVANPSLAATIMFTGSQENVDPKTTSLPTTPDSFGWRNANPAKPLDIDGDDVIGTDGYSGRAGVDLSGATYITNFNSTGGGNPFGYVDDPTDPTGIDDARSGFMGSTATVGDLFSFTITGSDLDGQTLGIAIMYDTFGTGTQIYELEQRDGGTGGAVLTSASSGALAQNDDGYDWAWFTITGATAGDVFVLKASRGTAGRITYSQVGFDTAAIPEPSAALLGGLGALLLLRRRRN